MKEYDPMLLDTLSFTGRVAWGRTSGPADGPSPRAAGGGGPTGQPRSRCFSESTPTSG